LDEAIEPAIEKLADYLKNKINTAH